jgi:N-acetylmuramoyl-L-alanine amidase
LPKQKYITSFFLGAFIAFSFLFLASGQHRAYAQYRSLYWGVAGNDVIRLQQQLSAWGYYTGLIDGYYGNQTWQAVTLFQRYNSLAADGIVGKNTWVALGFSPTYDYAPPEPTSVSRSISNRGDIYLLARVIEGEAADEPFAGKVAVGAVILNRLRSAAFPHTLAGVIYQPHAFESVSNGQYNRPVSEESQRAAILSMSGWDPTGGALFFWNPAKLVNPWVWTKNIITQIGRHIFAR